MKIRIYLLLLCSSLFAIGCASTTRFDQTCITCVKSQRFACTGDECPSTFMVGDVCLVSMTETGENLYVSPILLKENMQVKAGIPMAIAKLNGKYFVTGESFTKLWILKPNGSNEASYDNVELPEKVNIQSPVFEIYTNKLVLSGKNLAHKYIYDEDSEKWSIKDSEKGE